MPPPTNPKPKTDKIIPEDALNLELKYLDENIRPFLLEMDKAYANYIMGGSPLPIIAYGLAAINAVIRVDRFEIYQIEKFRTALNKARQCINTQGKVSNKEFNVLIVVAMDVFGYEIGKARLYARPLEEQTESGMGKLLKQMVKESAKDGS